MEFSLKVMKFVLHPYFRVCINKKKTTERSFHLIKSIHSLIDMYEGLERTGWR
jgi:hypothetical protein